MARKPTAEEVQLALNWLEAGYLDDTMLEQPAYRLVRTGLEGWLSRRLGETPMLADLQLSYSVEGNFQDKGDAWDFCIDVNSLPIRVLEPVFKSIEDKAPGLFETAIHTLETVVGCVALAGTPGDIRQMAVNGLWMGHTTTDDLIEELQSCEYDEESIAEMMTPDKFDGGLPEWLLKAKQCLTQKQLRTLIGSTDAEVAGIAKCVLDLLKLKKKVNAFGVDDMSPLYPLVLLRWSDMDSVVRVHDDIVHEANVNGGDYYTSEIHIAQVGRTPEEFRAWLAWMEPSLTAIKIANQLIGLMSIEDEDR